MKCLSYIDNFWTAYNSISHNEDSVKQIKFINQLYISKANNGLEAYP